MTPEPIEAVIARLREQDFAVECNSDLRKPVADLSRLLDYVEAMRWRPIESAPKDGAVLLAFSPEDTGSGETTPPVCIAYWDAYYAPGGRGHRDEEVVPWVAIHAGQTVDLLYSGKPTHWMPLPPPPVKGGAA